MKENCDTCWIKINCRMYALRQQIHEGHRQVLYCKYWCPDPELMKENDKMTQNI